jgi:uncharacterized protein
MEYVIGYQEQGSLSHILRVFALSLLVSFLGTLFGAAFIPVKVVPLLSIITLVMIIAAFLIRRRPIGYAFLYTFTAISGITMYPVLVGYGSLIGARLVSAAFGVTALLFFALSLYAAKSKRNFSYLGGFLTLATLGLILMGLVSIFVSFGAVINVVWAFLGILIFSGWVLYDISQYRNGVSPEWVPTAALNLYLNFINLFYEILRFISSIINLNRD